MGVSLQGLKESGLKKRTEQSKCPLPTLASLDSQGWIVPNAALGVVPWVQISAPPWANNPGDPKGSWLFQSCRMQDAGGLDPRPRDPCLSCNRNGAATWPALPEGDYEVGTSRVCCSHTEHAESDQVSRNDRVGRKPALHWLLPVLAEHWTHLGTM